MTSFPMLGLKSSELCLHPVRCVCSAEDLVGGARVPLLCAIAAQRPRILEARLVAFLYAVVVVDAQQALEFSVGIFPVCHDAQRVIAAVVNPKVLRYSRPRSKRDGAMYCDIVEDEVPQEKGGEENGSEQKNDLGPSRWPSHLGFPMITAPSRRVSGDRPQLS